MTPQTGGELYLCAFQTDSSGKSVKTPLHKVLIEYAGLPTCDINFQNFSDVLFPPPYFTTLAISKISHLWLNLQFILLKHGNITKK